MIQAVLQDYPRQRLTIGQLSALLICQVGYLTLELIFERLCIRLSTILLQLLITLLEVLRALGLNFLELGSRLANLLVKLLKLDSHAYSPLYELAHIVVENWKMLQIRVKMPEDARMKVVLNVVLPVLLHIIHAEYCILAMRQKQSFKEVCVGKIGQVLHHRRPLGGSVGIR